MPVTVIASASNNCESFKARLNERRAQIESARNMNIKRLRADVQRIAKKELEFIQDLIDEAIPVRATWNEEAWQNVQQYVPIRVESKTKKPQHPSQGPEL